MSRSPSSSSDVNLFLDVDAEVVGLCLPYLSFKDAGNFRLVCKITNEIYKSHSTRKVNILKTDEDKAIYPEWRQGSCNILFKDENRIDRVEISSDNFYVLLSRRKDFYMDWVGNEYENIECVIEAMWQRNMTLEQLKVIIGQLLSIIKVPTVFSSSDKLISRATWELGAVFWGENQGIIQDGDGVRHERDMSLNVKTEDELIEMMKGPEDTDGDFSVIGTLWLNNQYHSRKTADYCSKCESYVCVDGMDYGKLVCYCD